MPVSRIMSTLKILTDLLSYKTKNKNKKCFCRYCLQCFSSEKSIGSSRRGLFRDKW